MRSDLVSRPRPSRARQVQPGAVDNRPGGGAAEAVAPLLSQLFGGPPPVRVQFWDGTSLGAPGGNTLEVRSPDAVRRLLWSPGELGLARAFVAGDLAFEGDIFEMLAVLNTASPSRSDIGPRLPWQALRAAHHLGALGRPIPPPPEEAAPRGRRHSRARDAQAVRHHYDVSNDFYAMVLGPTMTYSCPRFSGEADTLESAQESKHDLICRKLGLPERAGQRILDVGCGWGSLAIHAARHYGAQVVGVTLSPSQAQSARATGSRPPGWSTRSRSGSRTTATYGTGRSTASPPSGCSSMSDPPRAPSTSMPCAGCSGPGAGCSTTRSRAWADRASARGPSWVGTSSPMAS